MYNLDAIISIGYRINSKKATHFRKWSREILKQYMRKGFVINKDLLINGGKFTEDYFEELVDVIREIRSSERIVYEKVTDLFATAYDYNKNAEITKEFYAKVQNKLHYVVVGLTAPELYMKGQTVKRNIWVLLLGQGHLMVKYCYAMQR